MTPVRCAVIRETAQDRWARHRTSTEPNRGFAQAAVPGGTDDCHPASAHSSGSPEAATCRSGSSLEPSPPSSRAWRSSAHRCACRRRRREHVGLARSDTQAHTLKHDLRVRPDRPRPRSAQREKHRPSRGLADRRRRARRGAAGVRRRPRLRRRRPRADRYGGLPDDRDRVRMPPGPSRAQALVLRPVVAREQTARLAVPGAVHRLLLRAAHVPAR
jgi:hypothetical protein